MGGNTKLSENDPGEPDRFRVYGRTLLFLVPAYKQLLSCGNNCLPQPKLLMPTALRICCIKGTDRSRARSAPAFKTCST